MALSLILPRLQVFIVTSDHGDMQMERQQFYKMVPYEPSASVPMVISDGRAPHATLVTATSSLIDLFPTIMDYAQVPPSKRPRALDPADLLPAHAVVAEVLHEHAREEDRGHAGARRDVPGPDVQLRGFGLRASKSECSRFQDVVSQ